MRQKFTGSKNPVGEKTTNMQGDGAELQGMFDQPFTSSMGSFDSSFASSSSSSKVVSSSWTLELKQDQIWP